MENKSLLEEEIFSLQYEMRALADKAIRNKAERWIPGFIEDVTHKEHLQRYQFATAFTSGKTVLDIACGSGYGSYILANEGGAKYVDGVDLDAEAIRYGNHRYPHHNIQRFAADAVNFETDKKYDVIVSFETIEHVPDYRGLLNNFRHLLTSEGILLISTPVTRATTLTPLNPFHVIEWSYWDFQNLVNEFFDIRNTVVQNLILELEKVYPELSILDRIKFKLKPALRKRYLEKIKHKTIMHGEEMEDFTAQYKPETIINGYQIVVAHKKQLY